MRAKLLLLLPLLALAELKDVVVSGKMNLLHYVAKELASPQKAETHKVMGNGLLKACKMDPMVFYTDILFYVFKCHSDVKSVSVHLPGTNNYLDGYQVENFDVAMEHTDSPKLKHVVSCPVGITNPTDSSCSTYVLDFYRAAPDIATLESMAMSSKSVIVVEPAFNSGTSSYSTTVEIENPFSISARTLQPKGRAGIQAPEGFEGSGVMAASSSPAVKASQGPKSGVGKVAYPNRSCYEGQFSNYMRHGQGVLTLSDGTRYVAQWKNDERHGEGKEFCPDGTTFEGHYVAGMRHGYGVMKWPEGSKYSGMFERGRANGQGELLRTDGSVYRGQFCEDCMSGEGRMQWRDGVEYIGQFVANKREGYGTMTWMSGRWKKYAGQWKDGMQNEVGVLVDHNDQEFKGFFKMGKLDYWIDER